MGDETPISGSGSDSRAHEGAWSTQSWGNSPVYDAAGNRIVLRDCWRKPSLPFRAPICHEQRARWIGWNLYRCPECAAKIEPERLWHRLMLWRNPFRRSEGRPFRTLVRVVRWAVA